MIGDEDNTPEPLRSAMGRARRCAAMLRREESDLGTSDHSNPVEPTDAERWILGRADELDAFVEDVVRDYRQGHRSADETASLVDGFAASMHEGFARVFGRVLEPSRAAATSAVVRPYLGAIRKALGRMTVSVAGTPATPTPPN